mgnify:CR=1 FL=1
MVVGVLHYVVMHVVAHAVLQLVIQYAEILRVRVGIAAPLHVPIIVAQTALETPAALTV